MCVQLCPTLCDPTDCSMPGFPVLHYLIKFAHTHVHRVSDAIHLIPILIVSVKHIVSLHEKSYILNEPVTLHQKLEEASAWR